MNVIILPSVKTALNHLLCPIKMALMMMMMTVTVMRMMMMITLTGKLLWKLHLPQSYSPMHSSSTKDCAAKKDNPKPFKGTDHQPNKFHSICSILSEQEVWSQGYRNHQREAVKKSFLGLSPRMVNRPPHRYIYDS